ncbi:MAG: DNA cytosine methyltransferase [Bacteroidales bacterium]
MNEYIGVDVFSGAGGMALGATYAGVKVLKAIEKDYHAALTYKHNNLDTEVINDDILNVNDLNIERSDRKLIIFGGPPCQGFSTSNQKTRSSKNPNNWLFLGFFNLINKLKPEIIVFENVKGIIETENAVFFNRIIANFENIGYTTSHWILNAADYGVPQFRNRLFIIGSKKGKRYEKPKQTIKKHVSVGEAINDLPILSNGSSFDVLPYKFVKPSNYALKLRGNLKFCKNHLVTNSSEQIIARYKTVPQGGNWENIPVELMKNYSNRMRCHTGIYRRLREDLPSVVIGNFRKNMLIHPKEDRGLSVREAARLQSFPDSYEFKGSIGFQQQQVGDAVPPLLAKSVFDIVTK